MGKIIHPKKKPVQRSVESQIKVLAKENKELKSIAKSYNKYRLDFDKQKSEISNLQNCIREKDAEIHTKQEQLEQTLKYFEYIELYAKAHQYFIENDGYKDIESIHFSRKTFERWESYFIKLSDSFNNLFFELLDVIEENNYPLIKPTHIMSFPIDYKNREKNRNSFSELFQKLKAECLKKDFVEKIPDNLLSISFVNVRVGSNFDYFLYETDNTKDIQSSVKQYMNTILSIMKVLDKSKDKLMNLQQKTLQFKRDIYQSIEFFDPKQLMPLFSKDTFEKTDTNEDVIIKQVEQFLKTNYQNARNIETLVNKYRKEYFSFIERSLIKVYNDLNNARESFKKEFILAFPKHSVFASKWQTLYDLQIDIILSYMKEQLDIRKIECKKGALYDDKFHKPFDKSENDDNAKSDTIKTIINEGFVMKNAEIEYVIKPVDVIVVK
ncbi:MAG: hypothetical protein OMM_01493 [Candidatus Magnetoglobus multicellularis str. Araruama]|uniref:Nucleotide exchange factor GrpE n=1 Tax=Candidatus Magnetoglobus multicellularis str. Araruama TaxID=890399 RepID=A0A1V1PDH2_9BACT|nr:MAG: hypothetical protein OMM_01493 [Candidatus Magnetoglobus multicellularis str. Araruama]